MSKTAGMRRRKKQMAIVASNLLGITVFFFLFALLNEDESVEKIENMVAQSVGRRRN